MKKQQKLLSLIIFIFGLALVSYLLYPEKFKLIEDWVLLKTGLGGSQEVVLGEQEIGQINLLQGLSSRIMSEELVKETTDKVNQIIGDKIEENKDLPEKLKEKAKEEVRKQIYQEICEQWLGKE